MLDSKILISSFLRLRDFSTKNFNEKLNFAPISHNTDLTNSDLHKFKKIKRKKNSLQEKNYDKKNCRIFFLHFFLRII